MRGNGEGTVYKYSRTGKWCGQITVGTAAQTGEVKRKSVYGDTKKEAQEKLNKLKNKLIEGTYSEESQMKLSNWMNRWIEGRRYSLAHSTYRNYDVMIRNHINPEIGDKKLNNLKVREVQELLNYKFNNGRINGEGGLSHRTVKYICQTLSTALNQAIKEGIINKNVCEAVELPKKQEEKELQTWNKNQVNKFLQAAEDSRYYSIFNLALNTGMRRGELIGLKWKDVFLDKNRIRVNRQVVRTDEGLIFKKVKTESGNRTIPITKSLVDYLKSHRIKQKEKKLAMGEAFKDNDLVTCNKSGAPVGPRSLVRKFKKLLKDVGLPEIRFHDLRHTFSVNYLENGDINELQKILGHSSIDVTIDTYSHVTEEMLNNVERNINKMYNVR